MKTRTISQAAREAGVGVETIRYYQRIGLLSRPPKPAQGGYRRYSETDLARLRFIREAQQLGFTLKEIRVLIDQGTGPQADCLGVREVAQAKLEDLRQTIARLQSMSTVLEELVAGCPGCGPLDLCTIWNEFQSGGKHECKA